jgi:hypothetical protein
MKLTQLSCWFILVTIFIKPAAFATTTTWQGGGAGLWSEAGNWTGGLPQSGDIVVFNDTTSADNCTIDVDVDVGSLTTVNYSGALTFEQGTAAGLTLASDLYLDSAATLVCTYSSLINNVDGDSVTNGTGRVIIVGGDAVVLGEITSEGHGFPIKSGPGKSSVDYYGASYGGLGTYGGSIYGSLTQPISLGSGGSGGLGSFASGGGAIKLVVTGSLTVDGIINSDAGDLCDNGGSGGSVWIDAETFQGTGSVTASGVGYDRSGSGGRIAIYYTTSSFSGSIDLRSNFSDSYDGGQSGTLWEPKRYDNQQGTASVPSDVVISNSFHYYFPDNRTSYWNLIVTDSARIYFNDSTINISNLTVIGRDGSSVNDLSVLRGDIDSGGSFNQLDCIDLNIGGSVVITNNGEVYLSDATVTSADISVTEGSMFAVMPETIMPTTWNDGVFGLGDDSTIYLTAQTYTFDDLDIPVDSTVVVLSDITAINTDAGGSEENPYGVGVTIECQSASIFGEINGDGRGFASLMGPGGYQYNYYGAAHGGNGVGRPTETYGNLTRPSELGSGGSFSAGGSALKIVADGTISLSGTISALGEQTGNNHGSPGSAWLVCNELTGDGSIDLFGSGRDRPSGGGRTAIECTTYNFTGDNFVYGDSSGSGHSETGTIYICTTPNPGGDGVILDSDFTTDDNSVKIVRTVSQWKTGKLMEWTDVSTAVDGTALPNIATYVLKGLDTAASYVVYEDDIVIDTWSQIGDTITIPDITVSHVVLVSSLPSGSVFVIQ